EIVKIKRELSQLDAKLDAKLEARFKDFKDELMDDDIVTLMDDNDLYIVMRQHLKFFRIDVQLNTDWLDKPCVVASQSSTPLRLPSLHPPSKGFNIVAADSSKQPVASSGNPCTTIDVFDPNPLRDGVLQVVILEIYRC
ncbi:hypothetical protein Goshw_010728, partial [Gossypium schwendimanii]|nr:hypothetical protein [Gossypium schwendimanii]